MKKNNISRRILQGTVLSNKMKKTIIVSVVSKFIHPLYKKAVTKRKKYKVHDENNDAKIGDIVKIVESRPLSSEKRFKLLEIVQ